MRNKIGFCLLTKARVLLVGSQRRWCCNKIKKTRHTLDVETFNLNEEMVAKKGQTLKKCEILSIFSLLLCFCLTGTAR